MGEKVAAMISSSEETGEKQTHFRATRLHKGVASEYASASSVSMALNILFHWHGERPPPPLTDECLSVIGNSQQNSFEAVCLGPSTALTQVM